MTPLLQPVWTDGLAMGYATGAAMSVMRLRILGESVIEIGERRVEPSAPHLFALLLYLGVERGKSITRSTLCGLLFPSDDSSTASHNLRQLVYRARKLGLVLQTSSTALFVDPKTVEDQVARELSGTYSERRLRADMSLLLLPGYSPPTSELSRWLEDYRDRLNSRLLSSLCEHLLSARATADWAVAELIATSCLELDPFNETAILCLAESLARTGSKQKALSLLQRFEDEVGLSSASLALPPRLLKKRIANARSTTGVSIDESPIVGRSAELGMLSDVWSKARAGNPILVTIAGERLMGKSRLLTELASTVHLDASGIVVVSRRAVVDRDRPMSLFADLCAQLVCLPGAAGCSPRSISYLNRLNPSSKATQLHSADLQEVSHAGEAIRCAVLDLVTSLCSEKPLLLCIDNCDYLDKQSLSVLSYLATSAAVSPLCIVMCGSSAALSGVRATHSVRLKPLSSDATLALAMQISSAAGATVNESVLSWCVSSAGGNPGHLEMLLAHSGRTQSLGTIPADLLALIDEQLGSLEPIVLHALQACVILGIDSSPEAIACLTGIAGYALITSLEMLEAQALVTCTDHGIQCRSDVVAARALKLAPEVTHRILHGRAAVFLEERARLHSSHALAWRIAGHWHEASDMTRAVQWRHECWQHMMSIGQPMVAAESIRGVLQHATSIDVRALILDSLVCALQAASELPALIATLDERIALSAHLSDTPSTTLRLAFDRTEALMSSYDDPVPLIPRLRTYLTSADLDISRRIRAARHLIIAADCEHNPALAAEVNRVNCKLAPSDRADRLYHQNTVVMYHAVFGDCASAQDQVQELIALASEGEHTCSAVHSILNASIASRMVDPNPVDCGLLVRHFEECTRAAMGFLALRLAARLTLILFDDGHLEESRRWGAVAQTLASSSEAKRLCLDFLTSQVDLALADGRFEDAQTRLDGFATFSPVTRSPRYSKEHLVYRLRVAQFRGHFGISQEALATLLRWHDRARAYGRHDDHMEVLWVALAAAGDSRLASSLLTEYLMHSRRERRRPNYFLRLRTAADPAWSKMEALESVERAHNTEERDNPPRRSPPRRRDGAEALRAP